MKTCATHGMNNCPAFCAQGIITADDGADPGGITNANADAGNVDAGGGQVGDDEIDHESASRARDVGLAMSDVGDVRNRLRAMRGQLADLQHALEYVLQGIENADQLLLKYDAQSPAKTSTPQ